MTVKDVKKFIENFIDSEYKFTAMKYDIEIHDESCEVQAKNTNSFFHTNNAPNDRRTGREFRDEEKKQSAITNKNRTIPRILFQIRHYQNPNLGDALKRITIGNGLFACYVSYPTSGGRDLYFSSIFYIANTNEGWKIIYEKSFNSDTGIWYHPVDMSHVTVIDEGQLIETEQYIAPVEASSLADYNKD